MQDFLDYVLRLSTSSTYKLYTQGICNNRSEMIDSYDLEIKYTRNSYHRVALDIYNDACNHDDGGDVFIFPIVNIPFSSRNNLTSYYVVSAPLYCLTSSEQYLSYIQNENKFNNV